MQKMMNKSIGLLSFLLMAVSLSIASVALADEQYIFDQPNVVSAPMKDKLEKLLTELDTKKNLLIEEHIIKTIDKNDPHKIIGELAHKLDARGSKAENRALVLYVLDDNFVEIYPNEKLAAIIKTENIASITQNAKNKLQEKNYDEMTRIAIAGIYHYYQKNPTEQSIKKDDSGKSTLFNMLIAVILLVVVVGIIKMKNRQSL